jgi:signal transduction histidine kinase
VHFEAFQHEVTCDCILDTSSAAGFFARMARLSLSYDVLKTLQDQADAGQVSIDTLLRQVLHPEERSLLFEDAIENAPLRIALIDGGSSDGRVMRASEALAALLGTDAERLRGASVARFRFVSQPGGEPIDLGAVPPGTPIEVGMMSAAGIVHPVRVNLSDLTPPESGRSLTALYVDDLTDLRNAQAMLVRERDVRERLWDNPWTGVAALDDQGNLVATNKAFDRMVLSSAALVDTTHIGNLPLTSPMPDFPENAPWPELLAYWRDQPDGVLELQIDADDGPRHLRASLHAANDEQSPDVALTVWLDITDSARSRTRLESLRAARHHGFERDPRGIWLLEANGDIAYANPVAAQWEAELADGEHAQEPVHFWHFVDDADQSWPLASLLASNTPRDLVGTVIRATGAFPAVLHIHPGEPEGRILLVVEDLTPDRELARHRASLAAGALAIELLPGVLQWEWTTGSAEVTLWGHLARQMFGAHPGRHNCARILALFDDDSRTRLQGAIEARGSADPALQVCLQFAEVPAGVMQIEVTGARHRTEDGTEIWRGFACDSSAAVRAAGLEQARDQALEQSRQTRQNILKLGYEMRSHLASMDAAIYLLKNAETPEERSQRLDGLERGLKSLAQIVEGVQGDIQMFGDFPLYLVRVDLVALIEELVSEQLQAHQWAHLYIEGGSCVVEGDYAQLRRAFDRLLKAILLVQSPELQVRIALWEEAGWGYVALSDNGNGRIRTTMTPPRHAHAAISLADDRIVHLRIVQQIVERHGGQVEIEAMPSIGTTYEIRLPLFQARP